MKKLLSTIEKITNIIEVVVALFLLVIIAIRIFETGADIFSLNVSILSMEFNKILSNALGLVIGLEFVKMLCRHCPEAVIDVLLFAVARHLVIYSNHEAVQLLVGMASIAGLFATKKFLCSKSPEKPLEKSPEK